MVWTHVIGRSALLVPMALSMWVYGLHNGPSMWVCGLRNGQSSSLNRRFYGLSQFITYPSLYTGCYPGLCDCYVTELINEPLHILSNEVFSRVTSLSEWGRGTVQTNYIVHSTSPCFRGVACC